jgi:hypothetical protein
MNWFLIVWLAVPLTASGTIIPAPTPSKTGPLGFELCVDIARAIEMTAKGAVGAGCTQEPALFR